METLTSGVRYRLWAPEGTVRASVLLVHGLGEHSGRYQRLAEIFNQHGFVVIAPDHLGHGESPGTRVYVEQFDDYLPALHECRSILAREHPELPCFVLGHSMGGLITARLLLEGGADFSGALFSGPAFAPTEPLPAAVMFVGKLLAKLMPKMGMVELDVSGVSRDPKVVAAYQADPLIHHGKVTAGLGIALFSAMDDVISRAAGISLPVLIMHGEADKLAAPHGSQLFYDAISSSDKTLKMLPNLFHEIFNEPEGDDIVAAYAQWIEERLG